MNERDVFLEFVKAFVETPLTIILLILDLVGLAAVVYWVVDDLLEGLVVIIFLLVILASSYLIFRKVRRQLFVQQYAQPRVEFAQARQAQMYHDSPVVEGRTPTYQILQAWFANAPELPTDSSVARHVTAKVDVFREGLEKLFEYHGQWARSNAPDHVGFDDILDEVEIRPGHLKAKLILALKYPADAECYAFTREGMRSTSDGRTERFAVPPGSYTLKVHLSGIGIDDMYHFKLENPGSGKPLELSPAK